LRQRSKSDLVREAIVRMLEDVEDAELAEMALAQTSSSKPLSQLRKELGLEG
jgi:RHH-type transcriptional regulator, rel operon repressor / antitoxin RelB